MIINLATIHFDSNLDMFVKALVLDRLTPCRALLVLSKE